MAEYEAELHIRLNQTSELSLLQSVVLMITHARHTIQKRSECDQESLLQRMEDTDSQATERVSRQAPDQENQI